MTLRYLSTLFPTGLVWAVLAGGLAFAQQSATLTGTVEDADGAPLPGSNVVLVGADYGTAVGADGSYRLSGIEPGTYTVRVTFIGYEAVEEEITFDPGDEITRTFTLERAPLQGEGVTVTVGSRARNTVASELAVPVDVYSADQIESIGTAEVGQILQEVAPSANFPRQTVADGMDALRSFTLRGLSPDHTLVLVNGKRRHKSALVNRLGSGVQKGSSPVDLNALPASAIEQIEVLRDGAAAKYGSDAIAGVVNVQLKQEPLPLTASYQLGGHVTRGFNNDGTTHNVSLQGGTGLGDDGYLNLFTELRLRDPTNRAGASPRDQIEDGDADEVIDIDNDGVQEVVEKNNPVPQPTFHWGDGESDNVYAWADGAYPVSDAVEVYAFGGYSYRNSVGEGFYRRAKGDRNWPSIHPQGFLPQFDINTQDYSASVGLRGTVLGGWDYDLNLQSGENDFEYNIDNSLNVTLGPNSTQTSFDAGTVSHRQSHAQLDLTRGYDVGFDGPLNVSFGSVFRIDEYDIEAGERASWVDGPVKENQNGGRAAPGAQVFPGFRPEQEVDESRTNVGVYTELESNVTDELLVNLAGRFESYSDFGETVDGKLAIRFQPQDAVTFRASGSTGFRAPNLAQSFFSKVSTTFLDDPDTGELRPFEVQLAQNESDIAEALGVPDLEEETSINLSTGVTIRPADNFTFSADGFFIDVDDRIILSGELGETDEQRELVQEILSNNGIENVARVQTFANSVDTQTWGIDLTAKYQTTIGESGRLRLTGAFNQTQSEVNSEVRTPDVLGRDFRGSILDREARLELTDERPDNRLNLDATYEEGGFTAKLGARRYGETLSPDGTPEGDFLISSEWLFDLTTSYSFFDDHATVTVGARNLTDVYPDADPVFFGMLPFPTSSPFGFNGREVFTRLSVTL